MQKIDLDRRIELFRGCVTPRVRMSDTLIDLYGEDALVDLCSESEALKIRVRAATGVRIAMATDAVEIEYEIVCGAAARKIFTSDIDVNGVVTTLDGNGPHRLSLPRGNKNIVIHLPHLVVNEKISLSINDGAKIEAVPCKAKKLLICGDSIFQGMTCSHPTAAVGVLLADKLDVEFHNTSVGGGTMRPEVVEATIALGGDILLTGFGANDVFRGTAPDIFRKRTRKTLELLNDFNGKSFLVVPIPCLKVEPERREFYCDIIREEHKDFPCVKLINGADFYPADEELFADGTHPNDRGMKIYADGLAAIIAPELC